MTDTTITTLVQPGEFIDHLSDVLRSGAQALLAQAVEVAGFLERHEQERLGDGRARLVRHGHLPEREIQTGIGAVTVKQPRVRDRCGKGAGQLRFSPSVVPKYVRRSKSMEALIPWLYLKGISSGEFQPEPPRVYRRVFCSKLRLLYQRYSDLHRRPPLLLVG